MIYTSNVRKTLAEHNRHSKESGIDRAVELLFRRQCATTECIVNNEHWLGPETHALAVSNQARGPSPFLPFAVTTTDKRRTDDARFRDHGSCTRQCVSVLASPARIFLQAIEKKEARHSFFPWTSFRTSGSSGTQRPRNTIRKLLGSRLEKLIFHFGF